MRIVQEKVDKDCFLEICISLQDYENIKEFLIISKKCYIKGEETHVGIKLEPDNVQREDEYQEII